MRSSNSPSTPSYPGFPPHSPYMRRISPPGSPAPKKCCYDHKEQFQRDNFFCCCYVCPGKSSASILATLGVFGLVIGYTLLGAFTFMALEGGNNNFHHETSSSSSGSGSSTSAIAASKTNPKRDTSDVGELRTQTVDRLWSITENLNILYRENWTKLAAEEVLEFQEALFRALKNPSLGYTTSNGGTMFYHKNSHQWSFSSSFLYSLTLITTIGKSYVSLFTYLYRVFMNNRPETRAINQ